MGLCPQAERRAAEVDRFRCGHPWGVPPSTSPAPDFDSPNSAPGQPSTRTSQPDPCDFTTPPTNTPHRLSFLTKRTSPQHPPLNDQSRSMPNIALGYAEGGVWDSSTLISSERGTSQTPLGTPSASDSTHPVLTPTLTSTPAPFANPRHEGGGAEQGELSGDARLRSKVPLPVDLHSEDEDELDHPSPSNTTKTANVLPPFTVSLFVCFCVLI